MIFPVDIAIMNESGIAFDVDFQKVVDRAGTEGFTLVSATQLDNLNALVIAAKANGWFSKTVRMWVRSVELSDFATIDYADATNNALSTLVNAPTFTADKGFQPNGSTSYINWNYDPTIESGVTVNDIGISLYPHILGVANANRNVGQDNAAASLIRIRDSVSAFNHLMSGNLSSIVNTAINVVNTKQKSAAATFQQYKDGVKNIPTGTDAGVFQSGDINTGNEDGAFGDPQNGFECLHTQLTDAQAASMNTDVKAYMATL